MKYSRILGAIVCLALATPTVAENTYDLVINWARVIDPETSLDRVRNIGIKGREIAIVTAEPISGATEIDASGLVAAPGFIDVHAHGQDRYSEKCPSMMVVQPSLILKLVRFPSPAITKPRKEFHCQTTAFLCPMIPSA